MAQRSTFAEDFTEDMTPLDDTVYFMEQKGVVSEVTRTAVILAGIADDVTGNLDGGFNRAGLELALDNYNVAVWEAAREAGVAATGTIPPDLESADVVSYLASDKGLHAAGSLQDVTEFYYLMGWEDGEYSNPDTALDLRGGFADFVKNAEDAKAVRGQLASYDTPNKALDQWIEADGALKSALMEGREVAESDVSRLLEIDTSIQTKPAVPERSMEAFAEIVAAPAKSDPEFSL